MAKTRLLGLLMCNIATAMYGTATSYKTISMPAQSDLFSTQRTELHKINDMRSSLAAIRSNLYDAVKVQDESAHVFNTAGELSRMWYGVKGAARVWDPVPTKVLVVAAIQRTMLNLREQLGAHGVVSSQANVGSLLTDKLLGLLTNPSEEETAAGRAAACDIIPVEQFTDVHEKVTLLMGKAERAKTHYTPGEAAAADQAVNAFVRSQPGHIQAQLSSFMQHEYKTWGYSY